MGYVELDRPAAARGAIPDVATEPDTQVELTFGDRALVAAEVSYASATCLLHVIEPT